MWHHDVTNPRTCQFSAVCLTVFPFEFRPRTFTIGFYGKNSIISELMILECSFPLTIAPRPVSKHASSSHNTRLVGGGVAPRGWWHIAAKLLQCLQFPAWEQPLSPAWGRLRFPAWEHLPVPCLGTFAVPAWDACQFPAWERLPVCMPCLGMLAVPAWDACQFPAWERLPVPCLGTFASALPGHVLQSLPGMLCQFPAWERLPMPCLGMFASPCLGRLPVPCLGTFASALPGNVLQSLPGMLCQFPAWERLPMPCLGMFASPCLGRLPVPCLGTPFAGTPSLAELFSYAYRTSMRGELLRLFKPEMPRTPVPCYFVSAMNVK